MERWIVEQREERLYLPFFSSVLHDESEMHWLAVARRPSSLRQKSSSSPPLAAALAQSACLLVRDCVKEEKHVQAYQTTGCPWTPALS